MTERELKKAFRKWLAANGLNAEQYDPEMIQRSAERFFKQIRRDGYRYSGNIDGFLADMIREVRGYGPIQVYMDDPLVTEIMINGPDAIFVEKQGRKQHTEAQFDDAVHLQHVIEKMIRPTGRRVDETSPYVDFSLADGTRVNVTLAPIAYNGPFVTVRKFSRLIRSMEDLVLSGTMDRKMAKYLLTAVQQHRNMLFSGPTGCGKTTTLEVLSSAIHPDERIVIIEDTPELQLRQANVVRMLTRDANIEGKGRITLRELLKNSLRMRPNRILLGEIRGEEALDYLLAINSGHDGSLSIIHATSPLDALSRLENLILCAGVNISISAIRSQMARGVHLIVQQRLYSDGVRRVSQISTVSGFDPQGELVVRDLFYFREDGYDREGKIIGSFVMGDGAPAQAYPA